MKNFVLGFVIGLLFVIVGAGILAYAAMHAGERAPSIPNGATLVLHLQGDVPEQPPVELPPIPLLSQQQPLTMLETWQMLRKAAVDTRIKALVIEPSDLTAGWAKLQELHDDIEQFKKSGKPVYAYLRGASAHEYYVATAADNIYMSPEDELDVKGIRVELMFFKGLLDKFGVDMEFEHIGKYKDAPDEFTRTTPTPETVQVMNDVLDQYYGNLVSVIAQGRKRTPDQVRAAIDTGPFVGKETVNNGLVDDLIFEDQMYGKLKDQIHADIKRVSDQDYVHASVAGTEGPTKIAWLVGEGDITRGGPDETDTGDGITAYNMVRRMRQIENDSSIKGVIFRIDSPGGDGIASDDILNAAKELSSKKPMIISMSDLAASGGYFIAVTGDPMIAYPNTLTGSIGVFFGKADLQGLYQKLGITTTILKRGTFADIDSMTRPLNDAEQAKLHTELEVFYHGFVERVAAARKKPYGQIEPLAQGRVWLGEQAKQNGLVDDLGGIDRAVEMIKQRLRIPASEKITLVTYPPRRSWLDLLLNRGGDSADVDAAIRRRAQAIAPGVPLDALLHGGILRLMPYGINVR
ncbi:MAG TPA: signal peptide peptidase SppA [Bryobacteraceae bacterium]|nr:signal peptide peptidase SppA [Bryobacteraceae bacterium]